MRRTASLALVGLFAVFCVDGVLACGDKLLLASRDFPFSRTYAAIHPASILIYLPKAAKRHGAGSGLASLLRRAGHDAEVVGDAPRLMQTLGSGQVDIVLANIVDMPDAEHACAGSPLRPAFLPVLFDASAAALTAAASRYDGFALKDPDTPNHFLGTIDQAMVLRPSHARKKH